MKKPKFWSILKIRDFSILVFSQTISQFGDKLNYIALIALVGLFPKEKAPFLLSQLMVFITLPVLIFGPIAGVLVDRWHRKKVMIVCDGLRMCCALAIPLIFLWQKNIYPVFALVFFMFLLTLFFNTARSAIIPNLVSKARILVANSVLNIVGRVATFLGMLSGGAIIDLKIWRRLIGIDGWIVAFIIDGITFGVSAILLYLMKIHLPQKPVEQKHLEPRGLYLLIRDGLVKICQEFIHAVKIIIKEKNLSFAMATIFLMIIAGSVVYVLVIPTVQQEMTWGTFGVGSLASIGAIGLLLGAYLIGVFGHHFDLKMLLVVCFVAVGAVLILFPFLQNFWLFALVCLIAGIVVSPIFIGQDTLIHHYADEFIRGRVFSLRDWFLNASFALAALIVGSLSTFATKDFLLILFGIIVILLAAGTGLVILYAKSPAVPSHNP